MNRWWRIGLGALVLSGLLHVGAALLLAQAPVPKSVAAVDEPIWLELAAAPGAGTPTAGATVAPRPAPAAAAAARPSRGGPRKGAATPLASASRASPETSSAGGAVATGDADAAGASSVWAGEGGVPVGAPRRLVLAPSIDALPQPRDDARMLGQTLRNDGSPLPGSETPAVAGARTKRLIDGWIEDDQALMRAEQGMVDDYFGRMRLALSRKLSDLKAPEEHSLWASIQKGIADGVRSYGDAARSYGSSGNPYVADAPDQASAGESALERDAQQHRDGPAEALVREGRKAQTLRDFADGKLGNGLVAVVELRQSGDGRLVEETLLASSGNRLFDEHVLRTAPGALETLPPPPSAGMGIHADGLRSQWEFRGHCVYRRKLRDVGPEQLYLLALLPASLLTGSFDEMTGDVYLVDPGSPRFECRARLLRLY